MSTPEPGQRPGGGGGGTRTHLDKKHRVRLGLHQGVLKLCDVQQPHLNVPGTDPIARVVPGARVPGWLEILEQTLSRPDTSSGLRYMCGEAIHLVSGAKILSILFCCFFRFSAEFWRACGWRVLCANTGRRNDVATDRRIH